MRTKLLKRIPLHRLMDLKIDYAFKRLFGNETNKAITVVFLNAILQKTGRERIKDISFSNIEAGGEFLDDKQSRLDLLVVTEANEWINIEIQFTNHYDMIKRSIYYWSGVYRGQMKKGMGYRELRPVIAINILNFETFDKTEQFHTIYHLYEDTKKLQLTDMMEFHFIEISKLMKSWKNNKLDPWDDILARWLLMLGMVDHRNEKIYCDIYNELEEIAMEDEILKDAFKRWEELSLTQEEFLAYEARAKRILDEEAVKREAELVKEEAKLIREEAELIKEEAEIIKEEAEIIKREAELMKEEAIEQGLTEGKKEGRQEGRQEGRKIGQQEVKEEIARRLIAKGMDIDSISEITGLEKEQILEMSK